MTQLLTIPASCGWLASGLRPLPEEEEVGTCEEHRITQTQHPAYCHHRHRFYIHVIVWLDEDVRTSTCDWQFLHKRLIWGSHLCGGARCDGCSCYAQFCHRATSPSPLFLLHAVPQGLLANYTWCCCLIWAENIPEFPASNTSCGLLQWVVCVCVRHSGKRKNYSLALHFALSASLLIPVFNNSGGKRRIANQFPEKEKRIPLIGRPGRLLVRVRADGSTSVHRGGRGGGGEQSIKTKLECQVTPGFNQKSTLALSVLNHRLFLLQNEK